ncbi:hypothetical protein ACFLV5_00375 [Chloroflexota bacterium]
MLPQIEALVAPDLRESISIDADKKDVIAFNPLYELEGQFS